LAGEINLNLATDLHGSTPIKKQGTRSACSAQLAILRWSFSKNHPHAIPPSLVNACQDPIDLRRDVMQQGIG
jgi:hypothetical protein